MTLFASALLLAVAAAAPAAAPVAPNAAPPVAPNPADAPVPWVLRGGPRPVRDAGIGAVLSPTDGLARIEQLVPGMPGAEAGLKPGDTLVSVDGRTTEGRPLGEVTTWIRGEAGTAVTIVVRSSAGAVREVVLTRKKLEKKDFAKLAAESKPAAAAAPEAPPKPPPPPPDLRGRPMPQLTVDRWIGPAPAVGPTLAGHVVLVDFWATWCGPCRHSMPQLAALAKELGPKGLVVVGLSIDEDAESVEKFAAANPQPYALGWTMATEHAQFGTPGIPTMVLVGPDGVVKQVHFGGLVPVDEIRAAVNELARPKPAAP